MFSTLCGSWRPTLLVFPAAAAASSLTTTTAIWLRPSSSFAAASAAAFYRSSNCKIRPFRPLSVVSTTRLLMTAGGSSQASTDSSGTGTISTTADIQPTKQRGALIVLEGVDRCGKTTQVARLVKSLRANGLAAEAIRFPDRTTTIGTMINAYLAKATDLDDHAIHLLFSANRWEAVASLHSKLAAGTTLVCDRYAYSGVAFSAAKQGMDIEWCKQCDRGLPKPDAVIYLDISVEAAAGRGQYGEERYETQEMQGKVRENFQKLMEGDSIWHVVDAAGTLEEVSEGVGKVGMATVKKVGEGERGLETLWPL